MHISILKLGERRGGNNVVSLLSNTLQKKGVFEDAERLGPGKALTMVFDNCGGQNKNRIVLRYALYLVGKRIFKSVKLVFLVCGHTKNVCDCMFKELKQKFHHKNVYTMSQLVTVLDYSPLVHVIRAPRELHNDWDTYLTGYIKDQLQVRSIEIIFLGQMIVNADSYLQNVLRVLMCKSRI